MPISEGVQLLAPGVEVTLGGETYSLILDHEALCRLEDECDGLQEFLRRINDKRWRMRSARQGMIAGLRHTGLSPEVVAARLDTKQNSVYLGAIVDAWMQAMPPSSSTDPKAKGSGADSPGKNSTTSARSASGAQTGSSGA